MKLTFVILFALSKCRKIFRSIFFINHLVPSITTLNCYVCNSIENINCKEGNLEPFKQSCPQTNEPYCRKIEQISNDENDGKKFILLLLCV